MTGIYTLYNTVSNKVYIGGAEDITFAWSNEITTLLTKTHTNTHLQNSWNKYGPTVWQFSIFKTCMPRELEALKNATVDKFLNDKGKANVYNVPEKPAQVTVQSPRTVQHIKPSTINPSTRVGTTTRPNVVVDRETSVAKYFTVPFKYRKTLAAVQATQSVQPTQLQSAQLQTNTSRFRSCAKCSGPVYMKNKHYNKLCPTCYSKLVTKS